MRLFLGDLKSCFSCILYLHKDNKRVMLDYNVQMLTEYSYSSNRILKIFYKMGLEIKKGSGLCYLEVDMNRMN